MLRVLARTGALTFEEAYKISKYVCRGADLNKDSKLDFGEYFTAQEKLITFDQYTKHLKERDGIGIAERDESHKQHVDYLQAKEVWSKEVIPLLARRQSRGVRNFRDLASFGELPDGDEKPAKDDEESRADRETASILSPESAMSSIPGAVMPSNPIRLEPEAAHSANPERLASEQWASGR